MISGCDVVITYPSGCDALELVGKELAESWPHMVVEPTEDGWFYYEDQASKESWDTYGCVPVNADKMIQAIDDRAGTITLVFDWMSELVIGLLNRLEDKYGFTHGVRGAASPVAIGHYDNERGPMKTVEISGGRKAMVFLQHGKPTERIGTDSLSFSVSPVGRACMAFVHIPGAVEGDGPTFSSRVWTYKVGTYSRKAMLRRTVSELWREVLKDSWSPPFQPDPARAVGSPLPRTLDGVSRDFFAIDYKPKVPLTKEDRTKIFEALGTNLTNSRSAHRRLSKRQQRRLLVRAMAGDDHALAGLLARGYINPNDPSYTSDSFRARCAAVTGRGSSTRSTTPAPAVP